MRKKFKKTTIKKVTVPNLSGLTRSQAQAILSGIGLNYSESTTETSDSGLTSKIASQGYSSDSTVVIGSTIPFVYYNYVDPVTYGPCEAYGSGTNIGSGNQCSGTSYQTYTDYRYNTRKKVYVGGVWDGSSYSTVGCGTTDSRSITGSSQIDGLCGYSAPITVTYGACEAYGGAIANLGSGSYCSGTNSVYYTDYRYNARKKIYYNGSWDGSSYTTSGCSTVDSRNIDSNSQINGSCGYVDPVTYGACEAYGSALYSTGSGSYCSGTYLVSYTDYVYAAQKKIYYNGSWDGSSYSGCSPTTVRSTSSSQVDGSCGYVYVPPAPANEWYCTESYNGGGVGNCSYSKPGYNNSANGSGYSRQCTYGTSYPGCQSTNPAPVCTSYKYQCKSYDVTNSASTNYYDCYSVGACTAPRNPDGSRASCCATYA